MRLPEISHSPARQKYGFTLLEMSIVLIIISTLLGGGLATFLAYTAKEAYKGTSRRMQVVEQALAQYKKVYNRVPCPADIGLAIETADFGRETGAEGVCSGGSVVANETSDHMVIGGIPTKTLGLSDEYAFDSWGRRVRYMVDKRYTEIEGFSIYYVNSKAGIDNYASAANGSTASATSTLLGSEASKAIDGERYTGNGWQANTGASPPQSITINFNRLRNISEVALFSLQDGVASEPTEGMVCSLYCTEDYNIQYWNGSSFVSIPGASTSDNTKVWKKISFSPLQTTQIKVNITATTDDNIHIPEIEAYEKPLVYVMISHGQNGHGAYPQGGGSTMFNASSTNTNELLNCHCTAAAAADTFLGLFYQGPPTENPTTATDSFDDIVIYKSRAEM